MIHNLRVEEKHWKQQIANSTAIRIIYTYATVGPYVDSELFRFVGFYMHIMDLSTG
jgi:hypothetical protein